jgi:K+ transporter
MNTATTPNHTAGNNWFAFLFGAVFNLMAHIDLSFMMDYILQAVVGGIICLAFKVVGDILSPLWLKQKQKVQRYTRARKIKQTRRKRHD